MAGGAQGSSSGRAGVFNGYCPLARREPITGLEAADIQRWRDRFGWNSRGGGWHQTARFAGRSVHDVRLACDADYARAHGRAVLAGKGGVERKAPVVVAPLAAVMPTGVINPDASAASPAQAPSSSPPRGKRAGSALRDVLLRTLSGGVELFTTELAETVERLSPSCTCQLLALESKGLVLARRGAKRTHPVSWRLSPAGEREAEILKGCAQPWPSVLGVMRALAAGDGGAEAVGRRLGVKTVRASHLLWRGQAGGWVEVIGQDGLVKAYALTELGRAALAARDEADLTSEPQPFSTSMTGDER